MEHTPSMSIESIGPTSMAPALLIITSHRPCRSSAVASSLSGTVASVMSAVTVAAANLSEIQPRRSSHRAVRTSFSPRACSSLAAASPIPLLAPVTTATCPLRVLVRIIENLIVLLCIDSRHGPGPAGL